MFGLSFDSRYALVELSLGVNAQGRYSQTGTLPLNETGPELYAPGEILVKFKPYLTRGDIASLNALSGVLIRQVNEVTGIYTLRIPADTTVPELVKRYAIDPGVEWAEPNGIMYIAATPKDTYYDAYQNWCYDLMNAEREIALLSSLLYIPAWTRITLTWLGRYGRIPMRLRTMAWTMKRRGGPPVDSWRGLMRCRKQPLRRSAELTAEA